VLVLDEPTSALDARSELLIRESLAALRGSVTVFVVSHRHSMLDVCDRVMVLGDGHVEAFEPMAHFERINAFYHGALPLPGRRTS
jgi:ATP-binding cassette, subfamily B, bacterial